MNVSRLSRWFTEVCLKIQIYDINEGKGKVWVHVRTIPIPSARAARVRIVRD
jgi:hypothetical protein